MELLEWTFNGSEYTVCVSSIIWLLFKLKLSQLVSNLVYPGTVVQNRNMAARDLFGCLFNPVLTGEFVQNYFPLGIDSVVLLPTYL